MGPHDGQPVLTTGAKLDDARTAMVMIHGRGANAADILSLAAEFERPEFAYLAPDAAGSSWYPYSFLSPIEMNEPGITSGLDTIARVLDAVASAGIPIDRTIVLGFSQGACLALEFVARNARRYGGVAGLSGGLIGPDGTPREYDGSLAGTPVFLGCSDIDPHIPKERVELTRNVLSNLDGDVSMTLYPRMGHTINADEILRVRAMMDRILQPAA